MKIIYSLLFPIFALFYLPIFWMKGKGRGGIGSRLGSVPPTVVEKLKNKKVIWIHAVSVGEVALAKRLLDHWRSLFPSAQFILTVTTVAGYEVAQKSLNSEDTLLQFPVDFGFSVRRFIRDVHPDAVALLETEIWPNLIWELSKKKIPVCILNGRISDRAIKKYRKIRFFLKPILSLFAGIGAQDELMRDRFLELGAPQGNVSVTGNLKFDWQPPQEEPAQVRAAREKMVACGKFICLGASTHEGEEEILMESYLKLRQNFPELRLLLAPRHPERVSSVEALALSKGIRLKRVFTDPQNGYDEGKLEGWILDRMGVLAHLYPAAAAVFVGGSLVPVGGHNLAEPAYYAKPILFGPYMNNFLEMSGFFLRDKAAVCVRDAGEFQEKLVFWMQNKDDGRRMGDRAQKLVSDHRGALIKNTRFFCQFTGEFRK